MIVFVAVLGSFATSYILGNAIAPGNAAPRDGGDTKTEVAKPLAFPAPSAQPFRDEPTREKKTLAVLLLMLRDGRGAR